MKLLANNSQHCWMLHVVSVYTSSCMLLRVVGSCCEKFETGQTSIFEKFLLFKTEFLRKYLASRAVKIFIDVIILRKCQNKQFNKSTTFFYSLHSYHHKNDVIKFSKLKWNHKPPASGFTAKFSTLYGVISMVFQSVDLGKLSSICFLQ